MNGNRRNELLQITYVAIHELESISREFQFTSMKSGNFLMFSYVFT
jgi:hypothetical protein